MKINTKDYFYWSIGIIILISTFVYINCYYGTNVGVEFQDRSVNDIEYTQIESYITSSFDNLPIEDKVEIVANKWFSSCSEVRNFCQDSTYKSLEGCVFCQNEVWS